MFVFDLPKWKQNKKLIGSYQQQTERLQRVKRLNTILGKQREKVTFK